MRRRDFLTLLGGASAAWPLAVRAQKERIRRLGVLLGSDERDRQAAAGLAAFTKALAELGWVDGRNIRIEYRWGASDVGRIQAAAKELVGLNPDLVVTGTTPATAALQRETRTIPIVFLLVSDPVGSGFITSFPRPGSNLTGFVNIEDSLSGKWIEILKEIVPGITRAAFLFNPDTATYFNYYLQPFEVAARSSSIEPVAAPIHTAADIERVVASFADFPNAGLVFMPDVSMSRQRDLITSLAARFRVPAIYAFPTYVEAGGLISYGIDQTDLYRQAATYADRILKGAKPADLPVQLPTRFEFAVNLKTAKALGLTIPATLLSIADQVIE